MLGTRRSRESPVAVAKHAVHAQSAQQSAREDDDDGVPYDGRCAHGTAVLDGTLACGRSLVS